MKFKNFLVNLLGKVLISFIVWVLGLIGTVGISYFFTDIKDVQELAQKASGVVMQQLRKNKKEVVETVQVLVKEYHEQNPEAIRKFLFNHKGLTVRIVNDALSEYREDVKEIMTNISPEAQEQAKIILNEVENERNVSDFSK